MIKNSYLIFVLFLSISCLGAQKTKSTAKNSVTIKTTLHANRGKIAVKMYPDTKECKERWYDLSKRGTKQISMQKDCCWREMRFVEVGKADNKVRILGRLTAKENLCSRGTAVVTVREGKKEKGMKVRPVDIEIKLPPEKKETKK